jgi:hypothetical protein
MDSKRLKTFLLAVFAVIALGIGVFTLRDAFSRNYISDDMINNAVALLERDGIIVDASKIDRRIISHGEVKFTEFDKYSYYLLAAELLSGSEREELRILPNGCEITSKNKDVTLFDDSFNISYKTDADIPDAFEEISKNDIGYVVELLDRYLVAKDGNYYGNSEAELSYEIKAAAYDSKSGMSRITCSQTLDKMPLGDFELDMYFLDGKLVFCSGTWCFAVPETEYSSQMLDVINILFKEREYLADIRGREEKTVLRIDRIYAIYQNDDQSGIYYTPAYRIVYEEGESRIYNAVDGNLYQND